MTEQDNQFMLHALTLADKAEAAGEVTVGAVIVYENKIIGEGWNQPIQNHDPSAHAEIMALRAAAENLGNYRLNDCDIYVTLEPCMMCAGAIVHARIKRLVFGAYDPKTGVAGSVDNCFIKPFINHQVAITDGILESECSQKLKNFFKTRRA